MILFNEGEIYMLDSLIKKFPEIKGYIISNPADIYYLTGFYCVDSLLLYSENPMLVTDSRYAVAAKAANCEVDIFAGTYAAGVKENAQKQGLTVLGIQEDSLTAQDYLFFAESGFTLKKTDGLFTSLRQRKTDAEVDKIQKAQDITDKAFAALIEYIKPGVTEKQLRARLEYLMFDFGADGLAFDTIVASGINGAKPHAVPSDKKVEKGEFITFDFGARLNEYDSDMTRTVALGDISPEMERIYNAVLEAHEVSAAALKPGISGVEADAIARNVLEKYDLEKYFTHSLGHGVGIEIHELPRLSKKSDAILDTGDIVTIEPGVYIEGFCGVRIENMYAINRDGHKNLTGTDKKLIKL